MTTSSHKSRTAGARRAGFTLPETMLSSAILAVGLSIFMATFSMASKAIYNARNQTLAMNYAREVVESCRTSTYNNARLNTGTYTVTSQLYRATLVVNQVRTNEKSLYCSVLWTNYVTRSASTAEYLTIMCKAIH